MGTMTIDGRKVEFTDEKNVLTVIRNAGINIPTLCYHSELSTFVVSVQLRMTEAKHLPPVPSSRETEWLSIPTPVVLRNIVN